jgi:hypothetical protein
VSEEKFSKCEEGKKNECGISGVRKKRIGRKILKEKKKSKCFLWRKKKIKIFVVKEKLKLGENIQVK